MVKFLKEGLLTLMLVFWIIRVIRRKETSMEPNEGVSISDSDSPDPRKIISRPKDLRPLNDSVWELYKPPHDRGHNMDIIFFHGSQMPNYEDSEAFWKTWLSRDETLVWPKVWLAKEFPEARILSISYDSSIQKSEQMEIYLVIENLIHDIIWGSTCKAGQNGPVIFAGHCFGGIMVKAFLLKCDEEANSWNRSTLYGEEKKRAEDLTRFLQNCKAIFYYSPPAGGAKLTSSFFSGNSSKPLIEFLKILSPETARINQKFMRLQGKFQPRLITEAIGAVKKWNSKLWDFEVPEGSARQYADSIYWANVDHFSVSKAKDNSTCATFTRLRDLVADHYTVSKSLSITTDRGDIGEEMAKKLGITLAQLKAANPDVNWNDLYDGQVLKIPGSGSPSPNRTYKVISGDTGEKIAEKLGISFVELEDANPGVNWINLAIGQVLKVSGINFVQLKADKPGVNWESLHLGQVLKVHDSWSSPTYKVVSGDTGLSIAKKFGMTFSQLESLNRNMNLTLEVPASSGGGGDVGGRDGGGNKKNKITCTER